MSSKTKLEELLRFDHTAKIANQNVFEKARAKIQEEHAAKMQGEAEKVIRSLMELENDMNKMRSDFEKSFGKKEKEFNKLKKHAEAMCSGQKPPAEESKEEK